MTQPPDKEMTVWDCTDDDPFAVRPPWGVIVAGIIGLSYIACSIGCLTWFLFRYVTHSL